MSYKIYDRLFEWYLLNREARPILDKVKDDWVALLNQQLPEEVYQNYLHKHAGFFFGFRWEICIVISKLRLGADFTTDFIVAEDQRSNGLIFELVEIETPYNPPFTRKGIPSARLSAAIQQIQNWRRWLIENRNEARKLFPTFGIRTYREPNFTFTIIIGRRENSRAWLDRRNDLAKELRINIRSFDYLTDILQSKFFPDMAAFCSTEGDNLTEKQSNMLANPFFYAYPDVTWRQITRELRHLTHFIGSNAEVLLKHRAYNSHYDEFIERYGTGRCCINQGK